MYVFRGSRQRFDLVCCFGSSANVDIYFMTPIWEGGLVDLSKGRRFVLIEICAIKFAVQSTHRWFASVQIEIWAIKCPVQWSFRRFAVASVMLFD